MVNHELLAKAKAAWDADRKWLAEYDLYWIMPAWSRAPAWRRNPYILDALSVMMTDEVGT